MKLGNSIYFMQLVFTLLIFLINLLTIADGKTWQEDLTLTGNEKEILDKVGQYIAFYLFDIYVPICI